jgi:hypothetical protein
MGKWPVARGELMALAGPENAMAWGQWKLRGGWSKTVPLLIGYVAIVGVIIVACVQFNPRYRGQILMGWTAGLMGIQTAWLILFGCGRVTASIRQDVTNRMMESHRMMPMPPSHVIAGYISGSTAQGLLLFAATFLMGMLTSSAAMVSFDRWAASSAILLTFAMFMWCVSALAGFLPRGAGAIVWAAIMVPWVAEGAAIALLPGLGVLLSPIIGRSIFEMRATWSLEWTHAMALTAQGVLGTICFIGAVRKYRRPEAPAMGVALGLALLTAWCCVSWVGIRQYEEFRPRWVHSRVPDQAQVLGSMIMAMLVAHVPLTAAALATVQRRRHQALHDPAPLARVLPGWIAIAAATLLVVAIATSLPTRGSGFGEMVLRTTIVVLTALAAGYAVARWCYRAGKWAMWPLVVWIFVIWLVPVMVDMVRFAMSLEENPPPLTAISACSPPGAMALIWMGSPHVTTTGIVVQVVIASAFIAISLLAGRRSEAATSN